ncbi:MAG: hypothetical protein EOO89_24535, partial [Pedobacter sp.]
MSKVRLVRYPFSRKETGIFWHPLRIIRTTGINLIDDYPIEVGALLVDSELNIIKQFHSFIKPNNNFS